MSESINLDKFNLVEGDAYFTICERVINFRKTLPRIKIVREFIDEQNENSDHKKEKRKFSFKYDFTTRKLKFICTTKH